MKKKLNSIIEILSWLIETDDKNRNKIKYNLGMTLKKAEKMILNLRLRDLKNEK